MLLSTLINVCHRRLVPRRAVATTRVLQLAVNQPRPQMPASDPLQVFDRQAKLLQRDRAVMNKAESRIRDYLKDEVAQRVGDRLLDIKRRFPVLLDLGSGCGLMAKHIDSETTDLLVQCELSGDMIERDADIREQQNLQVNTTYVQADEEFLPFRTNSLDGAVSNLSLHWVNDLPGVFTQVRMCLKPDTPFIGALFGGETLYELRSSLQLAETEREGGFSPHISPFADVRDLGALLGRTGFNLVTVDVDEVVVGYPNIFELMLDLRGMGESNATFTRRSHIKRDVLIAADAIYKAMYAEEDGSIPATFQILYFIGWKASENQPKPKDRGSASVSFKDLGKEGLFEDARNRNPSSGPSRC